MVDATDFATPESALSAATKIKIYGKLRGGTGVNFVSSGTGSLTNDIVHVGASVLGLYTIALAKADLSDASAAWYDQYIISLSATGAAYQALVLEGVIDESTMSALISDIQSAVAVGNSRVLVAQSAASDAASAAQQANSRVILIQSRLSDFNSAFVSQLSDFRSDLGSLLTTTGVNLNASAFSDIRSAIAAGPAATVTASDISDIASAVKVALGSLITTTGVNLNASVYSDLRSAISAGAGATVTASDISDIASAVKVALASLITTTGVNINASVYSDLRSAITAVTASVSASDMSDIASRVDVLLASRLSDILSAAQQTNSRALVVQSMVSDTQSKLSDVESNLLSLLTTTGVQVNASGLSDIASAVWANTIGARVDSRVLLNQSRISDVGSAVTVLASSVSDVQSAVAALPTTAQIADGVWDEAYSGHTTAGTYGDKFGAHLPAVLKGLTTAGSTTTTVVMNATTGVDGAAPSGTNDFYNGRVIIFTSGALAGQATDITDYVGATQTLTVTALTGSPASGVTFVIV
jgi:hypothetical protein